jgi:Fic family protein
MTHLEKAFQLKKELDSLRPLSADDEQRIMQKFRLDWNYHSNHLEGNTLTYGETKALILFNITAQGKPLQDHIEMTGHNEAVKWIEDIVKQNRPLTENFIRELHKLILKEPYEVDAITPDGKATKRQIKIGEYKSTPNHVRTKTGEIFRFATPEETPALMHDLIDWYRKKMDDPDANAILIATEFHYKFIRIHPFDDGNGRTARILMNFILMQGGYPPVIIKTEDKQNYFAALQQADAGIIKPFMEYITVNLHRSLEIMISGAKGENIEEDDDVDKEIALLEQEMNSLGSPIQLLKSKDTLLKKFIASNRKFDRFYLDANYSIGAHSVTTKNNLTEDQILQFISSGLNDQSKLLELNYTHLIFKQGGFGEFNFNSLINFQFNKSHYVISTAIGNCSFKKLYSEQLSDEEIKTLINHEAKRHTAFIQQKIKEAKKEK